MGDDAEDDLVAKNFNSNGDGHDEWLTPKWITDTLGPFDLDPCSPGSRRPWDTAATHLAIEDDGLYAEWFGNVWCNPPYGKETFAWLAKLAAHGSGIALIFARTETIGFHAQVWGKADAVFFFKGRLKFHYIDGTSDQAANAPSCLVAYGVQSVEKLKHSGFSGRLVELQT
jgi:hypothetical protein